MENLTFYDFWYRLGWRAIFPLKSISYLPEAQKKMTFMNSN